MTPWLKSYPLRDNPIMAEIAKTGANIRIDGAIDYLNDEVSKVKALSGPPLKRIELSVYGFDYGATLARGFLYRLLDRCLIDGEKVEYQGAQVVVLFAGLFDAVDRSRSDIPLIDDYIPVPTSNVLGAPMSCPSRSGRRCIWSPPTSDAFTGGPACSAKATPSGAKN